MLTKTYTSITGIGKAINILTGFGFSAIFMKKSDCTRQDGDAVSIEVQDEIIDQEQI
jgi:predicted O-methyltransferase YrrM